MSNLTDEVLIKRASHAGRNLSVLALLASALTVVILALGVGLFTSPKAQAVREVQPAMLLLGFACVLVSIGYWTLAVAARRGNPTSVAIVMVLMVGQLVLGLVSSGIEAAGNGGSFQPHLGGFIIPVLVIIALAQSRKTLLELRERGLWEHVFEGAKPTTGLCILGGTLLVSGVLGLDGLMGYAGVKIGSARERETQHAKNFVQMIQTEERAFIDAMRNAAGHTGETQVKVALAKLNALEQKLQLLKKESADADSMGPILDTYGNALRQWKNGLENLMGATPDPERAQAMLKLGDKLRTEAAQAFGLKYGPERKS